MTAEESDDDAGDFPTPPRTLTDRTGRDIEYVTADESQRRDLVEMYLDFDPADRAQGIPPVKEEAINRWLDTILEDECVNVVARHDGSIVGHATLVPDRHGQNELAIFVHQPYQGAGIGTALIKTLLGQGQAEGLDTVWLTVERWNEAAISLYHKVGFETTNAESFELEMTIDL